MLQNAFKMPKAYERDPYGSGCTNVNQEAYESCEITASTIRNKISNQYLNFKRNFLIK